jgi:hypothetical protein
MKGTWTPISDQAMEISLPNGQRFVTNLKYTIKKSISTNPVADGVKKFTSYSAANYDKFDSQCDKTMVGFVQNKPGKNQKKFSMTNHNIRCFHAE